MKGKLLYEGKAKWVYQAEDRPGELVLAYKNHATAFNGEKHEVFDGKARLNNAISSIIFEQLNGLGVRTHFIRRLSETEQLVHASEIIPLEAVVRNTAAGTIVRRLGLESKTVLSPPVMELFYKNDDLGDPLVNDDHALMLCDITREELNDIKAWALDINQQLINVFKDSGLELVDFKLEFGRAADGQLMLADEISPDTCRLWDINSRESLDKDVFRNGTGDLLEVYEALLERLQAAE